MPEPDGSPVGTTLARTYPQRYLRHGVASSGEGRGPCPICGHPKAACTEETHLMAQAKQASAGRTEAGRDDEAARTANQAGRPTVEQANAAAAALGTTAQADDLVVVEEEVLEPFDLHGVTSHRILFRAGQSVRRSELQAAQKRIKEYRPQENKQAAGGGENK